MMDRAGHSIQCLHCDNGREFINEDVVNFLKEQGIKLETTAPYTPQQNGRVEREMQTVMEALRSMLYTADASSSNLWGEAVNTAVYILNRTPTSHTKMSTPFEIMYGSKPSIKHLRKFGCEAYMHIPECQRVKLQPKSKKMIFIGYDGDSENYRLLDTVTKKIRVSRNVIFNEDSLSPPNPESINLQKTCEEILQDDSTTEEMEVQPPIAEIQEVIEDQHQGRNEVEVINPNRIKLRSRDQLKKPTRFTANFTEIPEPLTYSDAMNSQDVLKWKAAIDEELESLKKNNTWKVVPKEPGMNIVGSKWVFKIKDTGNKDNPRFKARLCAKGFTQKEGLDYQEIFSPTTRYDSIRILLALAVQHKCKIMQFDVKTAFLHGNLDETIYMGPPEGAGIPDSMVCLLLKALYGLKQSSRCWNKLFNDFMIKRNFKRSEADKCVYTKENQGTFINVLYVDDGLVFSPDEKVLMDFIQDLKATFEITFNKPKTYVGIQIEHDEDNHRIFIHQTEYINKLINKFGQESANEVSVPADPHIMLSQAEECDTEGNIPYQEAVGSLMFAALVTRCDIMFATNYVSRFSAKFGQPHWNAVKRILRYLKGTSHLGIEYRHCDEGHSLLGYSDADHAKDIDTRRSTLGYVFFMSGGPITWSTQRQKSVALSTTEAEFVAACEATKDIIWIRRLLEDIENPIREPTSLLIDNQGAISLIKNPVFHRRTKHIDTQYNFVREKEEEKFIQVDYVSTEEQLADVFTKPLPRDRFKTIINKIGLAEKKF